MAQITICALYKFVSLPDFKDLRIPLQDKMEQLGIKGTLLLAHEGINGTVSGEQQGIDNLLDWLNQDSRLNPISFKVSYDDAHPFYRTKVKLKKEIVTMGQEDIDPTQVVGTYVSPDDWNQLISDPEVLVVDTRNDYEIELGTFKNAVNPNTDTFRQFPEYVEKNLDPAKHKKVAMFCTGGIRCEKSTAFMKQQGFEEVYHLEGGILQYLEDIPKESSMWEGDCFVFDNRVAVSHGVEVADYDQCYACRMPITQQDKLSNMYERGVSCPRCYGSHNEEQIARFRERERQVELSKQRDEEHLGTSARDMIQKRRQQKAEQKRAQARKS
jgi:UPF0176 protein